MIATKAKIQLESLTGLRGLAAFYVVFYHLRSGLGQDLPAALITLFSKGYLAVDLFFILSGFVMWISYASQFSRAGISAMPEFMWRRFARIYPLHLLILLAMAAFALLLMATGRAPGDEMAFGELPYHLLLIQNWGFVDALHWNDPAWSISAEFAAYLLFPLIAIGGNWQRRGSATIILAIAVLLLIVGGTFYLLGYAKLGDAINQTGIVRCTAQFGVGTALAALWQRRRDGADTGLSMAIGMVALIGGTAFSLSEIYFVPLFLAMLIFTVAQYDARLAMLSRGPIHYLGRISYAVYLSHMFLYTLFKLFFVRDAGNIGLIGAAGYILVVLTVSAMLHHLVEMPAQKWFRVRTYKLHWPRARTTS